MRSKPQRLPVKQPTSPELLAELLRFISVKFYPSDPVSFSKDKPRLLDWVVFEFARWLEKRAVTLPPQRFLEIIRDTVLMEALRHGNTGKITYRPAWLRAIVQSHLAHHGEEYYDEGKCIRTLSDRALWAAQRSTAPAPDPVRELAQAARLLKATKRPSKPPVKAQLTLL
jgi:hypothetical protein